MILLVFFIIYRETVSNVIVKQVELALRQYGATLNQQSEDFRIVNLGRTIYRNMYPEINRWIFE